MVISAKSTDLDVFGRASRLQREGKLPIVAHFFMTRFGIETLEKRVDLTFMVHWFISYLAYTRPRSSLLALTLPGRPAL